MYNILTYLETPKPVMKLRLLSHGTFMKLSLAFTCDIYRHIRHEWVSLDLLLVSKVIFFDNTKEKKLELGGTCFLGGWKTQFYIHLVYKSQVGTWVLLFGLFGQLRAVMKKNKEYFWPTFDGKKWNIVASALKSWLK